MDEHQIARETLKLRLWDEGRKDLVKQLSNCGNPLTLACADCTERRFVETRCDLKWCPTCQPALAARAADRFARIASKIKWPLFVTWTCKHGRHDDVTLLRTLQRGMIKIRAQRWWKRAVAGGVNTWEVTRGAHGDHPHGHQLIDCEWLAVTVTKPKWGADKAEWSRKGKQSVKEIADQWSMAIGRTGTVKVRRCWRDDKGGIGGAVREVLKYSVKGSELAQMPGEIGPLIDVLSRTRLVAGFGSMYGNPAIKRRRCAPASCGCGCSKWFPESALRDRLRYC